MIEIPLSKQNRPNRNTMKRKMNFWATAAFLFLSSTFLAAQDLPGYSPGAPLPCRTDEVMQEYYASHPKALERFKHPKKARRKINRPDTYVIPVVFHIFGTDFNGKKMTDSNVRYALQKTNEDFQGITANTGDDDPEMNQLQGDMNITFRLAEKDPNGAATTGILYHRLESGFGNYYAPHMPLYAWDNHCYMNVYIMNDLYGDGETTNSGVSWYPDIDMTNKNIARVVYNGAYLGRNTDENFRRVITHEFGHFLNLAHTFDYDTSRFKDGCHPAADGTPNPGDYVADTPKADVMLMGASDRNCEGGKTNWTNYMNYSYERTSMYTKGQVERMLDALDSPARVELWQPENLEKAFFTTSETKRIALTTRGDLPEATTNDGAFTGGFVFTAFNAKIVDKSFVVGTDYTLKNLPEGLSPVLTRISDTQVRLRFTGKAIQHDEATTQVLIEFKSSMIDSGTLYACSLPISLDFRASYHINAQENMDITISKTNNWKSIQLQKGNAESNFGFMLENRDVAAKGCLFVETYKKPLVGAGKRIQVLNYGDKIGPSSSWTTQITDYPALGTLVEEGYDAWKGKLGFVGFQFQNPAGETLYGWMKINVATDGQSFNVLELAYNDAPDTSIEAGRKGEGPLAAELSFSTSVVQEDLTTNDGSITAKIVIAILGDNSFAKTGVLEANTDYTLTGIPQGLVPVVTAIDAKTLYITFKGRAQQHEAADQTSASITLNQSVFIQDNIQTLSHSFTFSFSDAFHIITDFLSGVKAGGAYGAWNNFSIPVIAKYGYGAWEFSPGALKMETYKKPMICVQGSRHIAVLAKNTRIDAQSNWVIPGDYPDQLDLANASYQDWRGKTAYAGLAIDYQGVTLYGWFKITVSADGTQFTVDEYGYNEQPGAAILAGTHESGIGDAVLNESRVYSDVKGKQLVLEPSEGTKVTIFDLTGRPIWQSLSSEAISLSTSSWQPGIYLVRFMKEGRCRVVKIIVD